MADTWGIKKFEADIDAWIKKAEGSVEEVVEVFTEDVHAALVDRSPVDTGRFKANWQVTTNEAPAYALNEYDKTGSATKNMGKRFARGMYQRGGAIYSIHFSNMLIYANALEYGHSQQAPVGVIGIVRLIIPAIMAEAIRKVKAKNG